MARLYRPTKAPIAERPVPMIKSPSQRPDPARSSASAGRSLITTSATTWPWGLSRERCRGILSTRPVRRQVTRSRLSSPQPSMNNTWWRASGLIHMNSLPGNPIDRRPLTRSGPQAFDQHRPARWGSLNPSHCRVPGPATTWPFGAGDPADEPALDMITQPLVDDHLRGLSGLPSGDRRPTLPRAATCDGVTAQLTTDHARITTNRPGDSPDPSPSRRRTAISSHPSKNRQWSAPRFSGAGDEWCFRCVGQGFDHVSTGVQCRVHRASRSPGSFNGPVRWPRPRGPTGRAPADRGRPGRGTAHRAPPSPGTGEFLERRGMLEATTVEGGAPREARGEGPSPSGEAAALVRPGSPG